MPPRDAVLLALSDEQGELEALLAALDLDDWDRPTRCDGWTLADVVLHVAQSDELAGASVRGDFAGAIEHFTSGLEPSATIDDAAAAMVERERGAPGPDVGARWRASAQELRTLLEQTDLSTRVDWVTGTLTARTLATTRLAETWIHAGDVADALGRRRVPTERLRQIARLAWRTLPYAFARDGRALAGPVAFVLEGPGGELWELRPEEVPTTTVTGPAVDLCEVAARRRAPAQTSLRAEGVDADAVLELVRTYA